MRCADVCTIPRSDNFFSFPKLITFGATVEILEKYWSSHFSPSLCLSLVRRSRSLCVCCTTCLNWLLWVSNEAQCDRNNSHRPTDRSKCHQRIAIFSLSSRINCLFVSTGCGCCFRNLREEEINTQSLLCVCVCVWFIAFQRRHIEDELWISDMDWMSLRPAYSVHSDFPGSRLNSYFFPVVFMFFHSSWKREIILLFNCDFIVDSETEILARWTPLSRTRSPVRLTFCAVYLYAQ